MYSSNIDIKLSGRDTLSYVKLEYTLYVVLNCPNVDIKVSGRDAFLRKASIYIVFCVELSQCRYQS